MPTTLPLTPKEVRILRKFESPTTGLDWENPILQVLLKKGYIKQVPHPPGSATGEITSAGTAYLASLPA